MNRGAIRSNRTRFAFIIIFMLLTVLASANTGGTLLPKPALLKWLSKNWTQLCKR